MYVKHRSRHGIKLQQFNRSLKLFLVIILFIVVGVILDRSINTHTFIAFRIKLTDSIFSWYLNKNGFELETIRLDIPFKNTQIIRYKRAQALANEGNDGSSILISTKEDYVPAILHYHHQKMPIKLRLKGDWAMHHLKGDKWSYRVKLKGDHRLFGMKSFSLHRPSQRGYLYELFYHQWLKKESILGLRYQFVNVILNGSSYGVYAIEEHFDHRMVENNRFREGPILRFSEDALWRHWWLQLYDYGELKNEKLVFFERHSAIMPFNVNRIWQDHNQQAYFKFGKNLLESFRHGKLDAESVFDIRKIAREAALSMIMNGLHGQEWINTRFYYNPITTLLEPIGFDAEPGYNPAKTYDPPINLKRNILPPTLRQTPAFVNAYIISLRQLLKNQNLTTLIQDLQKQNYIKAEVPALLSQKYLSLDNLTDYSHIIERDIGYADETSSFITGKSTTTMLNLTLSNVAVLPTQIMGIRYINKDHHPQEYHFKTPITLLAGTYPQFASKNINIPINALTTIDRQKIEKITVIEKGIGSDTKLMSPVYWSPISLKEVIKNPDIKDDTYSFFVAGHVYGAPGVQEATNGDPYAPFFTALKKVTHDTPFDFGILTGDSVYKGIPLYWNKFHNERAFFTNPLYLAPGNHDLYSGIPNRIKHPIGDTIYRYINGPTYYCFTVGKDLFIVLNTSIRPDYREYQEQLAFLQTTLSHPFNRLFIFFHHEIYFTQYDHLSHLIPSGLLAIDLWKDISNCIENIDLPIYIFSGDWSEISNNQIFYDTRHNRHYINSSVGRSPHDDNFLKVSVNQNDVNITVHFLDENKTPQPIQGFKFNPIKDKIRRWLLDNSIHPNLIKQKIKRDFLRLRS
jgi:hypothetical protein